MCKKLLLVVLMFTAFAFTNALLTAEDNWNKEFTKEGITVFTRPVEGSNLKEFKGEGLINAPVEVCMNVMADVEGATKWRPDCIVSKLVKAEGNTSIAYSETKAPWPVSNRDVIVKSETATSPDKIVISFTGVDDPGLVPLKSGVVRITEITGMWIFVRKGNDTLATYQAKINPGGSIPAWLANKTAVDQPFKSLKGLGEMVKDPKYQSK
jgi:hypothetical protein